MGLLLVAGIDPLFNAISYGEPLARLAAIAGNASVGGSATDVADAGFNLRWLASPWLRLATEQELMLYPLVAIPAVAFWLGRRHQPAQRALALYVVCVFLWQSYGSLSVLQYAPLPHLPRYLAPLTVPVVALTAAWLTSRRWGLRTSLLTLVCLSGVLGAALDGGRSIPAPFDELHAYLRQHRPTRVVVDGTTQVPLWLAAHGAPTFALDVLVEDELSAVREVWPQPGLPRPFEAAPNGMVAAYAPAVQSQLRAWPRARLVARFEAPPDLHSRLLQSPFVLNILALGRDRYRMDGLRSGGRQRPAIELYRLSTEQALSARSTASARSAGTPIWRCVP